MSEIFLYEVKFLINNSLTILDLVIIVLYFIFIIWLGSKFKRRQQSSEHYFLGKRNLPSWVVGMSLFATVISSWTYIALPGKSFKDDLQYLMTISTLPFVTMLTTRFLIPLFRNKIKLSAYEFLEHRFGLPARIYGNLAFLIVHFGKMSAILYLLSLAISGMTGWNIYVLIAIIGFSTVIYTFLGGIEGVVWTDVMQGFLLLAGGIISLVFLVFSAPGNATNILNVAFAAEKFKLMSFSFDWHSISVYVLMCFGFNYFLQKYASDQTVVQRYLLAPTEKKVTQALWLSSGLIVLVWVMFMVIGALLWAFYQIQPNLLPDAVRSQPDKVFPYFIGHQLPTGISGLILVGLLAATMSTLASDLNCLGAILFDDYYNKIQKNRTEQQRLLFSRFSVLISGLLCVLLAMAMTRIHSMADAAFDFVSLVGGGVLGMYLLGIFAKRCHAHGLYVGLVAGMIFILWAYFTGNNQMSWLPKFPLHTLWIGLLGNIIVFAIGYLASLVFESKGLSTVTSKFQMPKNK